MRDPKREILKKEVMDVDQPETVVNSGFSCSEYHNSHVQIMPAHNQLDSIQLTLNLTKNQSRTDLNIRFGSILQNVALLP